MMSNMNSNHDASFQCYYLHIPNMYKYMYMFYIPVYTSIHA